ncbi:MAG: c-type cytochrome [Candidatus Sericytochromatia bacterium]|uniref:C-type cytochrome n=1 Tax=Candidatus Tanganyikabacteria bacterium TaxID=2961651 RepID=A0A938BJF0_9BACT|nr:c-type cytochrome [Candidatus Tanganyikabacteria bacterium]
MAHPEKRPHAIDGIEEYDNPLPRWWVWLFYGTIVFAAGYWILYPTVPGIAGTLGWSQYTSYAKEVAAVPKPQAPGAGAMRSALADAALVEAGKVVYSRSCAACHGPTASGAIGPSLLDDKWVRGKGDPEDILEIVQNGTAKGMPAWKGQLTPTDLVNVTAFVHRLSHGDDPHHPQLP